MSLFGFICDLIKTLRGFLFSSKNIFCESIGTKVIGTSFDIDFCPFLGQKERKNRLSQNHMFLELTTSAEKTAFNQTQAFYLILNSKRDISEGLSKHPKINWFS